MSVSHAAVPEVFQLSLPCYEGPVEGLVVAIDNGQLSLFDTPLAPVADQFLMEIRSADEVDLAQAGEFVRTMARLLVLKSAHLLATPEQAEPEDEAVVPIDLTTRNMIRSAGASLATRQGAESFPAAPRANLPPRRLEPRHPSVLVRAWGELQSRVAESRTHLSMPAFVRLETAINNFIRGLRADARVSVLRLLNGSSRQDAVIHFLAVLELVRRRQVVATQTELFGDIAVECSEDKAANAPIEWVDSAVEAEVRAG